MSLQLSDAEMQVEGERLKAAWQAGFEAARHWPNHTMPTLQVTWHGNIPDIAPNWKDGQNRPGWIT